MRDVRRPRCHVVVGLQGGRARFPFPAEECQPDAREPAFPTERRDVNAPTKRSRGRRSGFVVGRIVGSVPQEDARGHVCGMPYVHEAAQEPWWEIPMGALMEVFMSAYRRAWSLGRNVIVPNGGDGHVVRWRGNRTQRGLVECSSKRNDSNAWPWRCRSGPSSRATSKAAPFKIAALTQRVFSQKTDSEDQRA